MSFALIFCADGHLRVRGSQKEPLVPLQCFQEESGESDLPFMARWWDESIIFEQGLTVSGFLNGLKPWASFWSDVLGKDLAAYIAESGKPFLVKEDHNLWYAMISYSTDLEVEHHSRKSMADFADLNEFFNDRTPPQLLPFWNIESQYSLTGHKKGEVEHYSIHGQPMQELASLPLILNHYQSLTISDHLIKQYGSPEQVLFNAKAFGLRHISGDLGGSEAFTQSYVLGEKFHRLREVVEGFFEFFSSTPQARDEENESLQEMLQHSIESLPREEEGGGEAVASNDDSAFVNKKIVVTDGAFSGLRDSLQSERDYFERVLKNARKMPGGILKIGGIIEQPLPEKRFGRWIVEDADFKLSRKDLKS